MLLQLYVITIICYYKIPPLAYLYPVIPMPDSMPCHTTDPSPHNVFIFFWHLKNISDIVITIICYYNYMLLQLYVITIICYYKIPPLADPSPEIPMPDSMPCHNIDPAPPRKIF